MSGAFAHRARLFVAAFVVTLVVGPSLVRTSQYLDRGPTPSPTRLTRYFDVPDDGKSAMVPVDATTGPLVDFREPTIPRGTSRTVTSDERLPASPLSASPDTLRGPPIV